MPSSHAVSIVAGLLPLGLAWRRAAAPLCGAALLFIASRLALGMHWPSDLLVGAFIGAIIGFAGWRLENRLAAR
jgi:undecaprenyl-diphosphatase